MKVVVIPWGNPFQWEPIKYKLGSSEVKSRSTLPIVVKALKPEKILLIVLDTLVNLQIKDRPKIEPREFSNYNEVVQDVLSRVKWFINEIIDELGEDGYEEIANEIERMLENGAIEVAVAPGVGSFKNIMVEGNMTDFYHYILYKLAEWLPADDMEVYLDLTHGINFMPTLTYRALHNLLGLAAYLKNITLRVLNSEPFPQGFFGEEKAKVLKESVLHIMTVEDTKLRPKPLYSLITGKDKWNAFISAVTNGFPLPFAIFYPSIQDVKSYLEENFEEFRKGIEVEENGKKVVRRNSLSEDFKTAAKLYYLLRILNTEFRGYPKKEVSLNELLEISKKLFRKMPRIGIMVEDQLNTMKDKVQRSPMAKKLEKGWIDLGKVLREGAPTYGGGSYDPDPKLRNFIAHSGFEYNLVKLHKFGTEILIKYVNKETVLKFSIEALQFRLDGGA